jgi:hypothetical protein
MKSNGANEVGIVCVLKEKGNSTNIQLADINSSDASKRIRTVKLETKIIV